MGKPLKVDWGLAFEMFGQGLSLAEISRRTGIARLALTKHADRNAWKKVLVSNYVSATNAVSKSRRETPRSRADSWRERVCSLVEKHLEKIECESATKKISLDKLEQLVRLTDATDRTARRSFGLDNEEGGNRYLVQINGAECKQIADKSEVIDVESTPEP